jgi:3D (Asp-Asp-Asp) domain-containing protein
MSKRGLKIYGWALLLIILWAIVGTAKGGEPDKWLITAYCSCAKCCGKADGITASGKSAKDGFCAVNWLPFGTKLIIDDKVYTVQDRGAKSLFGDKKHHIRHVDIWMKDHRAALRFGKQNKQVKIIGK